MKLLLFATELEAAPSIKAVRARPLSENAYQWEKGYIVLSGMGRQAVIRAITLWANKVETIINLGIAASLQDFPIGEIVEVGKVGSQAAPSLVFSNKRALFSSYYPIHSAQKRLILSQVWDLVDMEGYGVALASQFFNKPFHLFKIISDFASDGGIVEIQKNISHCALALSDFVCRL